MEAHKASADSAVASVTSADGETAGHDHDTSALIAEVAEIVNDAYDLGEVVRVVQVFGGYVNLSFSVTTRTSGGEHTYFVRKYCPGITEREVRFEHALLNHLEGRDLRCQQRQVAHLHGRAVPAGDRYLGSRLGSAQEGRYVAGDGGEGNPGRMKALGWQAGGACNVSA